MSSASSGPSAPLRLPPPERTWRQTIGAFLGALMFGGLLVAACLYTLPALVTDWQVAGTARPVADGHVVDGSCSARVVFHICDLTVQTPSPGGAVSRRVNYVFTGVHTGDYRVRVLADPARPALATTDLGLERLWNRTITLALAMILLLALSVGALAASFINRRRARPSP